MKSIKMRANNKNNTSEKRKVNTKSVAVKSMDQQNVQTFGGLKYDPNVNAQ